MNQNSEQKKLRPTTKSIPKNEKSVKDEIARKNKVAFKASNPASLDLEQNLPDRCKFA